MRLPGVFIVEPLQLYEVVERLTVTFAMILAVLTTFWACSPSVANNVTHPELSKHGAISDNGSWKIRGGSDAVKGAYPWQVTIRRYVPDTNTRHRCGGSVINSRWVVSAAHCFSGIKSPDNFVIVAGEHDFDIEEGTEQAINVTKIIQHERYDSRVVSHDISLLKINGEFKFNQFVAPINLATPEQHEIIEGNRQMPCVTSGWGRLAYEGSSPSILQALVMPLLPLQVCQEAYHNVTEDMLCTGHLKGDKSPCHGDSGGPLACMVEDNWTLVGVVSWGKKCGVPGYPVVYARISYFHDWIFNKVANN